MFKTGNNKEGQQNINDYIQSEIDNVIKDFKSDVTDSHKADPDFFTREQSELQGNFTEGLLNDHIVSFKTIITYQNAGAAYPTYQRQGYNFDAKTGQRLQIDDVLEGQNYLPYLSAYSDTALQRIKTEAGFEVDKEKIKEAIIPKKEQFNNFVIEEDRIDFYFYYYPISNQREPDIWLPIPKEQLKPYLKANRLW